MVMTQQQREALADTLYKQYGRPLEAEHWGEYVAIAENGTTVLGTSLIKTMEQATLTLGRGAYIFKVGEQAIGRWR